MSIVIVVGTRSEIIKMTSLVKELEKRGVDLVLIHTGQYYEMNRAFLEELVYLARVRASSWITVTPLPRSGR